MARNTGWLLGLLLAVMAVVGATAVSAQEAAENPLDSAIAAMRNIDRTKMTEAQMRNKAVELTAAWQKLSASGPVGVERLKAELKLIQDAQQKDDFFSLGACALIYSISGLKEAETIGSVWSKADLSQQYNYVFFTAFEAARTQNAQALPMLIACLGDNKGSFFRAEHSMTFAWPLTIETLWGAFGPEGLPALLNVLETSQHPVQLESAAFFLTKTQYLPALPQLRKLAGHENEGVRKLAIIALGRFGHPQDYDFLVVGLKSKDPATRSAHIRALSEFGDMRAVDLIIPLMESDDPGTRQAACTALQNLMNVDALEAFRKFATNAPTDDEKRAAARFVESGPKFFGLPDWAAYDAKSLQEKRALLADLQSTRERNYLLKDDDRKLTHEELLEAAREWQINNRITGGKFEWVYDRHLLSAATHADIELLLKVQAKVYLRLSDECISEIRTLDNLILRLGRSRYRSQVGVSEKVEPLQGDATTTKAHAPAR